MQPIIRINERGAARVLNGTAGMTFVVERFSDGVAGEVAHVLDYRYPRDDAAGGYQCWSIAADGYELLDSVFQHPRVTPTRDDERRARMEVDRILRRRYGPTGDQVLRTSAEAYMIHQCAAAVLVDLFMRRPIR